MTPRTPTPIDVARKRMGAAPVPPATPRPNGRVPMAIDALRKSRPDIMDEPKAKPNRRALSIEDVRAQAGMAKGKTPPPAPKAAEPPPPAPKAPPPAHSKKKGK